MSPLDSGTGLDGLVDLNGNGMQSTARTLLGTHSRPPFSTTVLGTTRRLRLVFYKKPAVSFMGKCDATGARLETVRSSCGIVVPMCVLLDSENGTKYDYLAESFLLHQTLSSWPTSESYRRPSSRSASVGPLILRAG